MSNVTKQATAPSAVPLAAPFAAPFAAGQQVRLTAPFTGRCMTYRDTPGPFGPRPPAVLQAGTEFTVATNRRLESRCRQSAPETVLVTDANGGKWCIPTTLLELVPDGRSDSPN